MDIDFLRKYCLLKKGVSEDYPFDQQTMAMKVGKKIFVLTDIFENPLKLNLKFDPLEMEDWQAKYHQVTPGYHMNKKHWATVICDDGLPEDMIMQWIDQSYTLVIKGMTRIERAAIEDLA